MLLVQEVEPGKIELTWMWLPTWLGINADLKRQLEAHVTKEFVGQKATLDVLHHVVIEFFCAKFPEVRGLREYLRGVEKIEVADEARDQG